MRPERKRENKEAEDQKRPTKDVTSLELKKLYDALALDETMIPIENRMPKPIVWVESSTPLM